MTGSKVTALRRVVVLLGAIAAMYAVAGVFLCEGALDARYSGPPPPSAPNLGDAASLDHWRAVGITARDGAVLRAWFLAPKVNHGASILMLHGVGDTRESGLPLARVFLAHGYSVLLPDSRGHGESGGNLVTYGLREAADLRLWIDWLALNEHPDRIYALGESLGAAVLIQTLPTEPRLRAVVAECSFASLKEVALDRVAQRLPAPVAAGRAIAWPAVQFASLYARLKYGLDLGEASPQNAVARSSAPILLIHGLEDRDTRPAHSEAIAGRNPTIALWLVPHAGHTGAFGTAPGEFTERVLGWFAAHQ